MNKTLKHTVYNYNMIISNHLANSYDPILASSSATTLFSMLLHAGLEYGVHMTMYMKYQ